MTGSQLPARGYRTPSERAPDPKQRERDRLRLRSLLLKGATSQPASPADQAYFAGLRDLAHRHTTERL